MGHEVALFPTSGELILEPVIDLGGLHAKSPLTAGLLVHTKVTIHPEVIHESIWCLTVPHTDPEVVFGVSYPLVETYVVCGGLLA